MAKENKANADKNRKSFFQGVKAEFNKIIWTDRNTLVKQTGVVVAVTVLLSVIISIMDAGILQAINLIIK